MTLYQQNLNKILDEKQYPQNLLLLKKLILLAREGCLLVNGQYPDSSKNLFENLIEGHSFVIDFNQLDANYRHRLKTWLLDRHLNQCSYSFWERYRYDDYRGYTVEVPLTWWGRFLNWLWGDIETAYWPLADRQKLNPNFQLYGLTLQIGKLGWLFELKSSDIEHMFSLETLTEGEDDLEKARNSRRIMLTPEIVDKLVQIEDIDDLIYNQLNEPHPLSIDVLPQHRAFRIQSMQEYRKTELIEEKPPWYLRFGRWFYQHILSFFVKPFSKRKTSRCSKEANHSNPVSTAHTKAATKHVLFRSDDIDITKYNNVYQVREKWPGYSKLTCSGGGAKIFSLVGGYQACWEKKIPFRSFAGSSAGAIMSLLAYLGYEPKTIQTFFADFNQEVLLYNDWDKTGYSKTTALKAGLDYMIALKVLQIIEQKGHSHTEWFEKYLNQEVFHKGKITFRSLAKIKKLYPGCSLGEELVITASNIRSQRTTYFSFKTTPDAEISDACKLSASIPPLFKPSEYNGSLYTDGGLTSNFPAEVFANDDASFLSMRGRSLESLGFCFDNGREQSMLNNFRQRIYRESKLENWLYKLITGIDNAATAWKLDRTKLLQNSFTTVLLHADIPSTQFTVPPTKQADLIEKGYAETTRHLDFLYRLSKDGSAYQPCQLMYENFPSIEAILVHCCFRQNPSMFNKLVPIAVKYGVSKERIALLADRFYEPSISPSPRRKPVRRDMPAKESSFNQSLSNLLISRRFTDRMRVFVYLYPILLKFRGGMFADKKEYERFCKARHGTCIENPFYALTELKSLGDKKHLILSIVIYCLENYRFDTHQEISLILKNLSEGILEESFCWQDKVFIQNWSFLEEDSGAWGQLLTAVRQQNWDELYQCYVENAAGVGTFLDDDKPDDDELGFSEENTLSQGGALPRRSNLPWFAPANASVSLPEETRKAPRQQTL